jgi:isoquinoline 1-oxidoreductase alpha subunit
VSIEIAVNGRRVAVDCDPATPLLWVLRDHLRLLGTKFGCGIAQCGACTVHVGTEAVRSCVLPVAAVGERPVTTTEGLRGKEADALRAAWIAGEVPQCGYCQTGQLMSACVLLRENASPTDGDIDAAMAGNACRCATYVRIRAAIHRAAAGVARGGNGGSR